MRIPRERVLHIVINGRDEWREPAGSRVALEVQHKMATETFPEARSVRVREQYLGGAKAKLVAPEADEE